MHTGIGISVIIRRQMWISVCYTLYVSSYFHNALTLYVYSTALREWVSRARICKCLWSPGIDSEESGPPAYVAWLAGTTNRVVVPAHQAGNRFLGSLKGLQNWALAIDNYNIEKKQGNIYQLTLQDYSLNTGKKARAVVISPYRQKLSENGHIFMRNVRTVLRTSIFRVHYL
jgi:hypothetical protein